MSHLFPSSTAGLLSWPWTEIEPHYKLLIQEQLNTSTIDGWLQRWSDLSDYVTEQYNRLYIATTVNTADETADEALKNFLDTTFIQASVYEQKLKEMLLTSGLEPAGFEIALRNMRSEADLYREENLPLYAEEQRLNTEYDKLNGARTVIWEGEEKTVTQMTPVFVEEESREKREEAWILVRERILKDRDKTHALWRKFFSLRERIAANAGKSDYRSFAWQKKLRFDYTPEDCKLFHEVVEEVVVPAASRIYERRQMQLGVDTLRPWDTMIDPLGRPPLKPFKKIEAFIMGAAKIFDEVDPLLGQYFRIMMEEDLLDLENRKNKGPGAFCVDYPIKREPFIFMNAVGLHDDVQTILHEAGHAFHVFESGRLKNHMQIANMPMEFAEVASMSMELLASPYLEASGMYSEIEAARARIEHLEGLVTFWPYMALVDAFQHWIYENPESGRNPENCDEKWVELWDRFMPGIDYSGLEKYIPAQWHRQLHIHQIPFYYIEYGLAQLGAVQVWGNAFEDQAQAVKDYRKALALGSTATLPDLFKTAGAQFTFDIQTLKKYVDLIECELDHQFVFV